MPHISEDITPNPGDLDINVDIRDTLQGSRRPVARFRLGTVEAAVWPVKSENGELYNITFQRRYQDKNNDWQISHCYGPTEALALQKVADMAVHKIIELLQKGMGRS
jgi:hypothetical protein